MRRRRWGALVVAMLMPWGAFAGPVAAVETGGNGSLTKCPSLLPTHFCHTYKHIVLPERVAVGDTLQLSFGSNPKEYGFPVARIVLDGSRCTIFSAPGEAAAQDRVDIAHCHPAP